MVRRKCDVGGIWQGRPRRVWYREGTGRPCHGCEEVIAAPELQVDLEIGTIRVLRFHHECYLCWRDGSHATTAKSSWRAWARVTH